MERLEVRTADDRLLRYVPDHRIFELDETAADGVVTEVTSGLADTGAALLPARTLAEWRSGGTRYAVRPPRFRVDREGRVEAGFCVELSALGEVAVDDDETLRSAAAAFELVGEKLDVPVRTSGRR